MRGGKRKIKRISRLIIVCLYLLLAISYHLKDPTAEHLPKLQADSSSELRTVYGYLDRYLPRGQGIILIEEEGYQMIVSKELLPKDIEASSFVRVKMKGKEVQEIHLDEEKTRENRKKSQLLQRELKEYSNSN